MLKDPKIRTLDVFCGGGGSSWGARAAGVEIVGGIDAWDIATKTYATNFGEDTGIHRTLVEAGRLPVVDQLGSIDLILASPECRSHTCARGSGERDENSRRTAHYVLRFARKLKPRWIVIENVVHMRNWDGFGGLLAEAEALGYHVHAQVLDASTFGVPQKRRRLFLICDREEMPTPVTPPRRYPPLGEVRRSHVGWAVAIQAPVQDRAGGCHDREGGASDRRAWARNAVPRRLLRLGRRRGLADHRRPSPHRDDHRSFRARDLGRQCPHAAHAPAPGNPTSDGFRE